MQESSPQEKGRRQEVYQLRRPLQEEVRQEGRPQEEVRQEGCPQEEGRPQEKAAHKKPRRKRPLPRNQEEGRPKEKGCEVHKEKGSPQEEGSLTEEVSLCLYIIS